MGASHGMAGRVVADSDAHFHPPYHDSCSGAVLLRSHAHNDATSSSFLADSSRCCTPCPGAACSSFLVDMPVLARRPRGHARQSGPETSFAEAGSTAERLTRWRQKHERTQEGFLCAAAGVRDGEAFTGCTDDLPAPDGTEGVRWCYIEPSVAKTAGKEWGFCRAWSGWPDQVDPGVAARRRQREEA
mmetsp:Transcript_10959/g.33952  ORF Transcript_10959/g.33952 Transcript_10959/m.33952 type:complete len:187 (+) Transcript_10959:38-598(+)